MAARPQGKKRRERCIRATDAEWARIRDDASAAGLSVSEHVVRTLLARPEPAEPGLPAPLVRYLAGAVARIERAERRRFERQGGGDAWRALAKEVDDWLEAEFALGYPG